MKKKEKEGEEGKVVIDLTQYELLPGYLVVEKPAKVSKAGYTPAFSKGYAGINWNAKPLAN